MQVEATRPPFDESEQMHTTKIPEPDWKPGQGANHLNKDGLWSASSKTKEIDPSKEDKGKIYKMMIGAIVPRPIGFISTYSKTGETNLAPFSYFNQVSHDPPMVMVSFAHPSGGETLKGTALNILDTQEFTANIISEPFVEAANYTSVDAPHGVSEWGASGLTPVPSKLVKAPRVGESAFSMECKLQHHYHVINDDGVRTHTVVLGRVVRFHVREDVIDNESLLIDTSKLRAVSRLGGITYARVTSTFEVPRPVWDKVKDDDAVKQAMAEGQAKAKV
ncbi:hypothetical protein OIV83_000605 [Microbotryomycetes sp. JL201]|nr:hypothetical protein OIV83_000605 [Microbotryomycetes sp. JL201]